jgi:hypothetical protein
LPSGSRPNADSFRWCVNCGDSQQYRNAHNAEFANAATEGEPMLVWACIGVGIWLALNVVFVVVRLWNPDDGGALDSKQSRRQALN